MTFTNNSLVLAIWYTYTPNIECIRPCNSFQRVRPPFYSKLQGLKLLVRL